MFLRRTIRTSLFAQLGGRRVPLEIVLLSRSQCIDGVIRMLDWYVHDNAYIIVMERLPRCQVWQLKIQQNNSTFKDLFDYITENRRLSDAQARHFFRQVVEMTLALAALNITHRDIKDENLLVDLNTGKLKLIDFGSGALLKSGAHEVFTELEGTKVGFKCTQTLRDAIKVQKLLLYSKANTNSNANWVLC